MSNGYEDIIGLPHPVSRKHPQMSLENRAAQFAPFAALTGYEDAIEETGRLTDMRIDINEDRKEMLDEKLKALSMSESPAVEITYFVPDLLKEGGSYSTLKGMIKRVDTFKRVIVMNDGISIPFDDLYEIEPVCENGDDVL